MVSPIVLGMDANEKPRKVSQVYVAKPVAKPEPLAAPELRVRSVIAPGSTRGHDTNNGGFEQTVAQPPHISATTPGESNNGGYETRVVQNG